MLVLIRDTITTEKGYLTLFMQRDWTPISLQDVSEEEYRRQYFIDHVSFGHDLETAFLMLEASHVTGLKSNSTTLIKAKKMVDHALANGWDRNKSGFFDAGYYFKDSDTCIIVNAKKIWWTQAEGLNALLLMSKLFPDETKYSQAFNRQWQYINLYMIDHEYGGWYGEGLDCSPKYNRRKKGYDWKGNYHNFRARLNCVKMLNNEFELLNEETK